MALERFRKPLICVFVADWRSILELTAAFRSQAASDLFESVAVCGVYCYVMDGDGGFLCVRIRRVEGLIDL